MPILCLPCRWSRRRKPAQEGFPRLFAHLKLPGIAPVGAPFYNYRRVDMSDTLDVEAGVAVARSAINSADIKFDTLPAGRYVTVYLAWTS